LEDKIEARVEGVRRFQRKEPITEIDLDIAIVVMVHGTKRSRLSREHRGRMDEERLLDVSDE